MIFSFSFLLNFVPPSLSILIASLVVSISLPIFALISINVFDSEKDKKIYNSNVYANIGDNVTSWTGDDEYNSDFNRLNQGLLYASQKYNIDIKRQEMKAASNNLDFERAIMLRDEINKLENNILQNNNRK